MKDTNRISPAQARFLRELRNASDTLAIIKHQHDLSEKRFGRWLDNRFFRANLRRVLRKVERTRHTVIALAAKAAADLLEEAVRKKEALPVGLVLSLKVLNELAHRQSIEKPKHRAKPKEKKRLDPERDLCHPATKHMEKELMI